jgi:hypothetical protein
VTLPADLPPGIYPEKSKSERLLDQQDLGATKLWLGLTDCTCPWIVRGGVLYNVSMGRSWVRFKTEPSCPIHGQETP